MILNLKQLHQRKSLVMMRPYQFESQESKTLKYKNNDNFKSYTIQTSIKKITRISRLGQNYLNFII